MKNILICALILLSVFIAGCASAPTPTEKALKISVTTSNQVTNCQYLGQVVGTAAHSDIPWLEGEQKAKNDAMDVAASLGATHIVWIDITDELTPKAVGKAYKCSVQSD